MSIEVEYTFESAIVRGSYSVRRIILASFSSAVMRLPIAATVSLSSATSLQDVGCGGLFVLGRRLGFLIGEVAPAELFVARRSQGLVSGGAAVIDLAVLGLVFVGCHEAELDLPASVIFSVTVSASCSVSERRRLRTAVAPAALIDAS